LLLSLSGAQAETGASQESREQQLWLGEFKMKVSLHESPARPTIAALNKI